MGEVNYFSSKIAVERNIESPAIVIPSIGVNEKINDESLSLGVLHEPTSYDPLEGDVLLFGHRTLQGSPFLRLNELSAGDELLLEWPGIGEVKYNVVDSTIVPADYQLDAVEGGNSLYLITCDPIGSTANRLIIKGELTDTQPVNNEILQSNPQESNALLISAGFLIIGLLFSLIFSKEQRIYILATVLIVSAVLFYCCINPIPSELIYDKIIFLNGGI
jgi:LPXTG-site transpeptidase (sortase) family protein